MTDPVVAATRSELVGSGRPVAIAGLPVGWTARRWRGADDLAAYTAVVNDSWAADGLEIRTSEALEANELRHLDDFDLDRDLALVEAVGRVVAFARANVELEDDGTVRHWSVVMARPEARTDDAIRALLRWTEGYHRRRVAEGPPSDAPRRLGAWAAERETWWTAILQASGYAPARWFMDMVREPLTDLPVEPALPGLTIDWAAASDLRDVLAASDEAFQDHWGHTAMTEAEIRAIIESPDADPSLWAVARDGDEIAGIVRGAVLKAENEAFGWRRGWISSVATRRPWRGRGVATALTIRVMAEMARRGLTSAALGVDTANPSGAVGLYERLGFRTDQRFVILFKPWPAG